MAYLKSLDPNIVINFFFEDITKKEDIDFYITPGLPQGFFPYRLYIDFYKTKFVTKLDYVSIIIEDLEKIFYSLATILDETVDEFDVESTEGDFYISCEKTEEDGGIYWLSIDLSGALFGQDYGESEGTAISFTFLSDKEQLKNFYNELIKEARETIEKLKSKFSEKFLTIEEFYTHLIEEDFNQT